MDNPAHLTNYPAWVAPPFVLFLRTKHGDIFRTLAGFQTQANVADLMVEHKFKKNKWAEMSVEHLKQLCASAWLSERGSHAELLERLVQYEKEQAVILRPMKRPGGDTLTIELSRPDGKEGRIACLFSVNGEESARIDDLRLLGLPNAEDVFAYACMGFVGEAVALVHTEQPEPEPEDEVEGAEKKSSPDMALYSDT